MPCKEIRAVAGFDTAVGVGVRVGIGSVAILVGVRVAVDVAIGVDVNVGFGGVAVFVGAGVAGTINPAVAISVVATIGVSVMVGAAGVSVAVCDITGVDVEIVMGAGCASSREQALAAIRNNASVSAIATHLRQNTDLAIDPMISPFCPLM